jgi:hypothetical protein
LPSSSSAPRSLVRSYAAVVGAASRVDQLGLCPALLLPGTSRLGRACPPQLPRLVARLPRFHQPPCRFRTEGLSPAVQHC